MFTFTPPDFSKLTWSGGDSSRLKHRFGDKFDVAAEQVAERIRAAAPERSGDLAASVRVEREGDQVAIKAGGTPETTGRGKTGSQDAVFDYAVAVEYGTGKMAAEPFFYPGAHAAEPEFHQAASDALSTARKD